MAERFRIVPMEPAHYAEAAGSSFPWQDNLRSGARLIEAGPAFTGFVDGQLAAVAGVVCKWPGQGDAWAIVTTVGRQHPVFVHRAVVRALRAIVQDKGLRRVTATVVRDWAIARGWVHALGFEKEATMRAYGPQGEDFVQYRLLVDIPRGITAPEPVEVS
jgi:hypothetical protein